MDSYKLTLQEIENIARGRIAAAIKSLSNRAGLSLQGSSSIVKSHPAYLARMKLQEEVDRVSAEERLEGAQSLLNSLREEIGVAREALKTPKGGQSVGPPNGDFVGIPAHKLKKIEWWITRLESELDRRVDKETEHACREEREKD